MLTNPPVLDEGLLHHCTTSPIDRLHSTSRDGCMLPLLAVVTAGDSQQPNIEPRQEQHFSKHWHEERTAECDGAVNIYTNCSPTLARPARSRCGYGGRVQCYHMTISLARVWYPE